MERKIKINSYKLTDNDVEFDLLIENINDKELVMILRECMKQCGNLYDATFNDLIVERPLNIQIGNIYFDVEKKKIFVTNVYEYNVESYYNYIIKLLDHGINILDGLLNEEADRIKLNNEYELRQEQRKKVLIKKLDELTKK